MMMKYLILIMIKANCLKLKIKTEIEGKLTNK